MTMKKTKRKKKDKRTNKQNKNVKKQNTKNNNRTCKNKKKMKQEMVKKISKTSTKKHTEQNKANDINFLRKYTWQATTTHSLQPDILCQWNVVSGNGTWLALSDIVVQQRTLSTKVSVGDLGQHTRSSSHLLLHSEQEVGRPGRVICSAYYIHNHTDSRLSKSCPLCLEHFAPPQRQYRFPFRNLLCAV